MKFKYMDPEQIMVVVVSLIILAVGVFAFFVTVNSTTTSMGVTTPSATSSSAQNAAYYEWMNTSGNISGTGNSVFNIVGIILIIGAIMTIVGLVYAYVRPGY